MGVLNLKWSGSFPFCLIPANGIWDGTGGVPGTGYVGPGTFYPMGGTLTEAMRWYWQVVQWQVAIAYGFSGVRASPVPLTFDFPVNDSRTILRSGTQQSLVCPTLFLGQDSVFMFSLWGSGSGPYAYVWDGLIYPFFYFFYFETGVLTFSTYAPDLTFPKLWPQAGVFDATSFPLYYDEEEQYDSVTGVTGDNEDGQGYTQTRTGTITITVATTY